MILPMLLTVEKHWTKFMPLLLFTMSSFDHLSQHMTKSKRFIHNLFVQNNKLKQFYQTFHCPNLLSFHGNTIILCYKAILPF
jgi:hypothetical protein